MEEKLFHNPLHFEIWLDQVLHVDDPDPVYEACQIHAGGITVPVFSGIHREQLKKAVLTALTPFLKFTAYYTWESHEKSALLRDDVLFYAPDAFEDLLGEGVTLITFLDLSGEEAVRHVLSIQNRHVQDLALEQYMEPVYKKMVTAYLANAAEPFDFAISGSGFFLRDKQTGHEVKKDCRDTNAYIRLFQEWQVMKTAYERRMELPPARIL